MMPAEARARSERGRPGGNGEIAKGQSGGGTAGPRTTRGKSSDAQSGGGRAGPRPTRGSTKYPAKTRGAIMPA